MTDDLILRIDVVTAEGRQVNWSYNLTNITPALRGHALRRLTLSTGDGLPLVSAPFIPEDPAGQTGQNG